MPQMRKGLQRQPVRTIFAIVAACGLSVAVQAQSTAAPYTTGFRYDIASRLVGQISPDPDGSGPIHYAAIRNTYNAQGVLARVEHGELQTWHDESMQPSDWPDFRVFDQKDYTYDDYGRKLTEQSSSGNVATALTQYTYDTSSRVVCVAVRMNPDAYSSLPADACTLGVEGTFGPDRITHTTYDALDRPLQVQKAYATPLQYTYQTNVYFGPLQSSTDANNNLTFYAYDGFVRLATMYFPSKTAGAGDYSRTDYEQYGYDNNGNRTSLRKRDNNVIGYKFDALNRVYQESYPVGTIANVFYGYDLRSLQLYAKFNSKSGPGITTTYDGFGNVATSSSDQSGTVRKLQYAYDAEANRLKITHPDGSYFTYSYDGLNRLSTIFENGGTTPVITESYDSKGHRSGLARGASVTNTSYGYDPVRLQTLTQTLPNASYNETRMFAYNPANQVISRDLSNPIYSFTQAPAVQTNYQVNGLNQYTQLNSASAVATSYDPNGNMTSDGATTFTYDVLNRLTTATAAVAGGKTGNLIYDPKGRLFQTSGGLSGTTQFLYDGDALVAEYDGAGALLRRYVHGAGVDEPLISYEGAAVGSANRRYFHADQQGSVIAIVDSSGSALQINTYDPYGVPATGNSGRFQYTGQIMLPDLGQYYYKARIYNPTLGRFMQTDPVGYKADLDLYTYVQNDPLDLNDASGTTPESWFYVGTDIAMAVAGVSSPGEAAFNVIVDTLLGFEPVPGASTAFHAAEGAIKVRAGVKVVEKVAEKSRRAGKEFSDAERAAAKAKNAEANGGKMTCEDCGKKVENVANKEGVTPPDNQAHVHHDPPISEGGGRDSKAIVLCRICHQLRHLFDKSE